MMNKEHDYRRNAADTVQLAQRASSSEDKGRLLMLAEAWLDLARADPRGDCGARACSIRLFKRSSTNTWNEAARRRGALSGAVDQTPAEIFRALHPFGVRTEAICTRPLPSTSPRCRGTQVWTRRKLAHLSSPRAPTRDAAC
jgi:hypothetical protein